MNKYAEYASDMNILLTYYKLTDDIEDDKSLSARISKKALRQGFDKAKEKHPQKIRDASLRIKIKGFPIESAGKSAPRRQGGAAVFRGSGRRLSQRKRRWKAVVPPMHKPPIQNRQWRNPPRRWWTKLRSWADVQQNTRTNKPTKPPGPQG